MKKTTLIFCLLFVSWATMAQSSKENYQEASKLVKQAIKLMDGGKPKESIPLLEKAAKLVPESPTPAYEMAYAYLVQKEYPKTIKILKKLVKHEKANDRFFQLLGNAYDYNKEPEKAIKAYKAGLKRFPNSGKIYTEWGILEYSRKNYDKAVNRWEAGIKANPYHASNYYWLTKIFRLTDERIWVLLYGEMFMNLTSNNRRFEEVAKWLYEAFQQSYTAKDSTSGSYNLTKKITIDASKLKNPDISKIIPFELTYSMVYSLSAIHFSKKIDLDAIYKQKKVFLENWFGGKGKAKAYPNKLLDFQKNLLDNNQLETYTYWLLGYGSLEEARAWAGKNKGKFEKLVEWLDKNYLKLKPTDKYSRKDY